MSVEDEIICWAKRERDRLLAVMELMEQGAFTTHQRTMIGPIETTQLVLAEHRQRVAELDGLLHKRG